MNEQGDDDYRERLVGRLPVRVRRRVLWGECDPAQVVYTPRFSDYLVAAFGWFSRTVLDAEAPTLAQANVGTPAKSMQIEFHHVLRPEELFEMTVLVGEIRNRTFDLTITGRGMDGQLLFVGKIAPIIVDRTSFRSVPIPDTFRDRLERYKAATVDPA